MGAVRRTAWPPVLVAAAGAAVTAALGTAATQVGPWYWGLRKSVLNPPDWAFGPAWTVIFGLAAWAAVLGWRGARTPGQRRTVVGLFVLNAALNVLWSFLFFRLRHPDWALMEVVPFWGSIALLMAALWPFARRASWTLLPYLVWVGYAAWLNVAVVRLN